MSKTKDELLKAAAVVRDEKGAGENTATRVGTLFTDVVEYAADISDAATSDATALATETTARKAADTALQANIDNEATARKAADSAFQTELLKRIQGTSDSSNAFSDPFINGGSFETASEMLTAISTHPLNSTSDISKYAGNVRYDLLGIIYDVHNFPISYASSLWLQTISGGLALNSDGTLLFNQGKYGVFYRYHNADGWTVWKNIEATDSITAAALDALFKVDDLGTFTTTSLAWAAAANLNTAAINALVGVVATVEQMDTISRPRILVYRACSTARGYATSAIINQHTYYDFTALGTSSGNADILIWQYLLAEGKTGKSYKRCITHNVALAVNTAQDAAHSYYYITALNSTTVGSWTAA